MLMVPPPGGLWSRHVLAAVDASTHAPMVARQAAEVAATCGLPLTVLSVAADTTPQSQASALAVAQRAAQTASEAVPALAAAPQVRVDSGRAYDAIVRTADAVGADLIVVGRRGETELADLLLGSTAQRVVGLAGRAVMLVRA
jgi:nucleotide-binding universal stress UspA family protein